MALLRQSMWRRCVIVGVVAHVLVGSAVVGHAASDVVRIGVQTAAVTLDPDAMNATTTTNVTSALYEPLIGRDAKMQVVPGLAASWRMLTPTKWRFRLRNGAYFHDGSMLTASDVVFSIRRAASAISDFKLYTSGIVRSEEIDSLTVDVTTAAPDPILPEKLTRVFIMNKAWAEAHHLADPERPGTAGANEEEDGTGPYELVHYTPNGPIRLKRFSRWWGWHHQADETPDAVTYVPIADDGARVAALLAHDVDVIMAVPPSYAATIAARHDMHVLSAPEDRTIMLALDQGSAELKYSSVKDKNPFKDRRVREAIAKAINRTAIQKALMGGLSLPTTSMIAPPVYGYDPASDHPPAPDLGAARALMREAGYQHGFAVTLDCPNHRYLMDVSICGAVASMLAKIGVHVSVNLLPFPIYAQKWKARDSSFALIGWGAPTFDGLFTLQALAHTPSADGGPDGSMNLSRYSNPEVDADINELERTSDQHVRLRLIRHAINQLRADNAYIPLHAQLVIWAAANNIDVTANAEDILFLPRLHVVRRHPNL